MNGQTITVNFAKPRNSERGRRDMFYGRSYGVSGVGWAGDGSLDTGGASERRRGHGGMKCKEL